jgi:hypothetical protein
MPFALLPSLEKSCGHVLRLILALIRAREVGQRFHTMTGLRAWCVKWFASFGATANFRQRFEWTATILPQFRFGR